MSEAKPYHHGDLRQTLVSLALAALETAPPEALTLRTLAKQAGVSAMAPYRHFANKEALLEAVAASGFADLRARLVAVDVAADARSALVAFGVAYVGFAVERPGLFRLMYGGPPPSVLSDADTDSALAMVRRRVAELAASEDLDIAFLGSWALVHGLATLLISGRIRQPVADPEALARKIGEFFTKAFRTIVRSGSA